MRSKNVEVWSERGRVPADGSPTKMYLRYGADAPAEVTLKLTRGSFDSEGQVREQQFPVENGEVHLVVYAPRRPGVAFLTGPGVKHRIDYVATSVAQSLVHEWVPTLLSALVLALVLRNFAVASFYIPSGSMENTLMPGDLLIADKFSYKVLGHQPARGDVMIFRYPDPDPHNKKVDYIKRIIGLPGDKVEVRDEQVYVNGTKLAEEYIKQPPYGDYGPVTVPQDSFFAMGDNRNNSRDSRVWGYVPRKNLEGRALFVFWPPTHAKLVRNGLDGESIAAPAGPAPAAAPPQAPPGDGD